ncbi:hypothetical protein E2562_016442 [Oryza meyeriana var. granulata]|uniref:Uncharacterized protein n=1 Tax=Oryza meyeriana var. granulata TaxID=110450 RepID=A0A6G1EX35_9ORYZ|nr:hypothetical protein E2562_016442 [Oryza meyeriana var. granulata]
MAASPTRLHRAIGPTARTPLSRCLTQQCPGATLEVGKVAFFHAVPHARARAVGHRLALTLTVPRLQRRRRGCRMRHAVEGGPGSPSARELGYAYDG